MTVAQGSALHSPVVSLHPAAQLVSTSSKEQIPFAGLQVPFVNERDVFSSSQVGGGGVHTMVAPSQAPLPSHASAVVQPFPSLQAVAAALGW